MQKTSDLEVEIDLDFGLFTGNSNVVAKDETAGGGDDAGEEDVERHLARVFLRRT